MHTCIDDRSGIYLEQVRLRRALVMILGSRPRRINVRGAATTSHTFDNGRDPRLDLLLPYMRRPAFIYAAVMICAGGPRVHDIADSLSSRRHRYPSWHARHGYQSKTLERGTIPPPRTKLHPAQCTPSRPISLDVSDSGGAAAHALSGLLSLSPPLPRVPLPPEEVGAHAPPDVRAIYKMYKTHRRRTHSKLTHSAWPTHCVSWIFSTLNDADVRSHPSPQQRLDDAGLLQDLPPPTSTCKAAPRHLNSCVDGDAERLVHVSASVCGGGSA
ncbi:hypothetical protein C8J57DRAFT_1517149 [Mycena rebaudengoi]|nr:hypothetical protein C8J57DRAFT_1517149 [Mycena rebaudengoi]